MIVLYVLKVTDVFLVKINRAEEQICLVNVGCVLSGCNSAYLGWIAGLLKVDT
jgi:hypothetical protein